MKRLLLLTALCVSAGTLAAQSSDATVIDRAGQPGLPPAQPPDAPAAGGDIATQTDAGDSGVQRLAEPRKLPFKLTATADAQLYYTDNVQLATDNSVASNSDAMVLGSTLALRAQAHPVALGDGLLTPSLSFVYQNFRHGIDSDDTTRSDLDFDAYSIPLTVGYRFGDGWEATASLTASAIYRIHGAGDYKRIVASYTPTLSLRKNLAINREQILVLTGGVSRAFTKATTDSVFFPLAPYRDDRNDKLIFALDATHYILKGKWVISPYARVAYADYAHYEEAGFPTAVSVNRNDLTVSAGLVVTYTINKWSSARLFTGYEWRDSDPSGPFDYSYQAATLGIGASVNLSF